MNRLGQVVSALDGYRHFIDTEVQRIRMDSAAGRKLVEEWRAMRQKIPRRETPNGLQLPVLALPDLDEPGQIQRFLLEEGIPGNFPYVAGIYPDQYLESVANTGSKIAAEEPTRLF